MSIKLEYILRRNRSNLKTFIQKNKLTSYQSLLEYCEMRKFIPCTEAEYNKIVNKEPVRDERKEVSRPVSKTQETKKRRNSRKKQQSTPELPDSSDEG